MGFILKHMIRDSGEPVLALMRTASPQFALKAKRAPLVLSETGAWEENVTC